MGHTRRDLHLERPETTDEVRGGRPLVLARNPLHVYGGIVGQTKRKWAGECDRTQGKVGD